MSLRSAQLASRTNATCPPPAPPRNPSSQRRQRRSTVALRQARRALRSGKSECLSGQSCSRARAALSPRARYAKSMEIPTPHDEVRIGSGRSIHVMCLQLREQGTIKIEYRLRSHSVSRVEARPIITAPQRRIPTYTGAGRGARTTCPKTTIIWSRSFSTAAQWAPASATLQQLRISSRVVIGKPSQEIRAGPAGHDLTPLDCDTGHCQDDSPARLRLPRRVAIVNSPR